MDRKLRAILRDFIKWQISKDLLKEPYAIDYELAETYLEETEKQLFLYGVVSMLNTDNEKDAYDLGYKNGWDAAIEIE